MKSERKPVSLNSFSKRKKVIIYEANIEMTSKLKSTLSLEDGQFNLWWLFCKQAQ